MTITASPTQIGLSGGVATITVVGFKPDGNPLNPGTQISLTTTLGTLASPLIESDGAGRATTTLSSDGRPGTATVTATLPTGGEGTSTADVLIGQTPDTQQQLAISVSPSTLGFNETATITAVARNADGTLFGAGGQVLLRTDLGTLDRTGTCNSRSISETLTTGGTSEAVTTFCSGDQVGTATITGTFGASPEVMATVIVEEQRPVLIVSANPPTIPVGGTSTVTILARDNNGFPLGSGQRIRLTAEFGDLDREEVFTDSDGEASAVFTAGVRPGTGRVTAILGNSESTSVDIMINDAPASFSFQASPQLVNVGAGDAVISLVVEVVNAQGSPVASATVIFGANIGGTFASGSGVVTTVAGRATDTFTVPQTQLVANMPFEVTASVIGEGVELPDQTRTITVDP